MSIKTFWTILIRISGLLLILRAISIVPESISSLYFIYENADAPNLLALIFSNLIVFIVICILLRLCFFKTNWIINTLKLDKGFETEKIDLDSSPNKIISIAVIVIGGSMFIQNLSVLLGEIFVFFQDKNAFKDYPKSGWIIFDFCKVIIGYLLMTNSFRIANFIGNRKSNN